GFSSRATYTPLPPLSGLLVDIKPARPTPDPDVTLSVTTDARGVAPPVLIEGAGQFHQGDTLAGRFRIVNFLGAGGMGEVYEAEDLELRDTVALKTIRPDKLTPDTTDRFRREVQLARRITHSNVCRVFDVFRTASRAQQADVVFVTMELLRGETLAQQLQRVGRLRYPDAYDTGKQIADGLAAAHTAGVVHRDLKTSNVMLGESGPDRTRAVVTDFGLATTVLNASGWSDLSRTGQVLGTPAYMAPEQLRGEEATFRTDVYAFGLVFYEMVCGVLPFPADTPAVS